MCSEQGATLSLSERVLIATADGRRGVVGVVAHGAVVKAGSVETVGVCYEVLWGEPCPSSRGLGPHPSSHPTPLRRRIVAGMPGENQRERFGEGR